MDAVRETRAGRIVARRRGDWCRTRRGGQVGERAGEGGRGLQIESGVGPAQHQFVVHTLKIKARGRDNRNPAGVATLIRRPRSKSGVAGEGQRPYPWIMQADELHEAAEPLGPVSGPTAEAFDPVLEVFKRDIDFTLVDKNLRLSTEQRAQQLVNATRFIDRFRPLVAGQSR